MGISVSRGRVLLLAFVVFLYISIQPIRAENNKVILADINEEITEATASRSKTPRRRSRAGRVARVLI